MNNNEVVEFCRKLNLNEEKIPVVGSTEGQNVLFAVPGSGKTTAMVARAGYIIQKGLAKGSEIVVLTFTRAAAEGMRKKFDKMFGDVEENVKPVFRTIHSYCYGTVLGRLRDCGFEFDYNLINSYIDVTDKDGKIKKKYVSQRTVAKEVLRLLGSGNVNNETEQDVVTSTVTSIKNRMLSPDQYRDKWVAVGQGNVGVGRLYDAYCSVLEKYNCVDFDDILTYALKGLEEYPEVSDYFRKTVRYWSIDEVQDNSLLQYKLLDKLISADGNLFMVGDDDQSIYNFRGAEPTFLLQYGDCKNVNSMTMSSNLRSDADIVTATAGLIRRNRKRKEKNMIPVSEAPGKVNVYPSVPGIGAQLRFIRDAAADARKNGYSLGVISRLNASSLPVVMLMEKEKADLNYKMITDSLFENPFFNAFYVLADFACGRKSLKKFSAAKSKLNIYYEKDTSDELKKLMKENPDRDVLDTLIEIRQKNGKDCTPEIMAKDFLQDAKKLSPSGFLKKIKKYYSFPSVNPRNDINILQYAAATAVFAMFGTTGEMVSLVKSLQGKIEKAKKLKDTDGNHTMTVCSIHASKGLEYDRVIIIDSLFIIFDMVKEPLPGEFAFVDKEEETRLFYVACTRAKCELDILKNCLYGGYFVAHTTLIDYLASSLEAENGKVNYIALPDYTTDQPVLEATGEKEERPAAVSGYYAVKYGRKPGIYTSWDECKKQTERFPHAVYKKFTDRGEAENFLKADLKN